MTNDQAPMTIQTEMTNAQVSMTNQTAMTNAQCPKTTMAGIGHCRFVSVSMVIGAWSLVIPFHWHKRALHW
jgi:hypothetical protein